MKNRQNYEDLILKTTIAFMIFLLFFTVTTFVQDYQKKENVFASLNFEEKKIVIGETVLTVNVADSNSERRKGLSNINSLDLDAGMLFIFDDFDFHQIWMKDMLFPIDIIWISDDMQVVHFEMDVSPKTYPKRFTPEEKARYVLEVPSGFVQKEGIKVGDPLIFF